MKPFATLSISIRKQEQTSSNGVSIWIRRQSYNSVWRSPPTGNIQLPNGAKLLVAPPNHGVPIQPVSIAVWAPNIQPKPVPNSNPMVIKVAPPVTSNLAKSAAPGNFLRLFKKILHPFNQIGWLNKGQPVFVNLTQAKTTGESLSLKAGRPANVHIPKPVVNMAKPLIMPSVHETPDVQ